MKISFCFFTTSPYDAHLLLCCCLQDINIIHYTGCLSIIIQTEPKKCIHILRDVIYVLRVYFFGTLCISNLYPQFI